MRCQLRDLLILSNEEAKELHQGVTGSEESQQLARALQTSAATSAGLSLRS